MKVTHIVSFFALLLTVLAIFSVYVKTAVVYTTVSVFSSEDKLERFLVTSVTIARKQLLFRKVGIVPGEALSKRVEAVWKYVAEELSYVPDEIIHINGPLGYGVIDDYTMYPNETIRLKVGDCDDLAVLVFSLLYVTSAPGDRVYLLLLESSPSHVIVYAEDAEGNSFILDPSFALLNGTVIKIEYYNLSIYATALHPTIKEEVISAGGRYVYEHAFEVTGDLRKDLLILAMWYKMNIVRAELYTLVNGRLVVEDVV